MEKRIVYPTESGIAIVIPAPEVSLDLVAKKDIPAGVPFLVVDESDIPEDRTFRNAWEADFSNPHGVGGEGIFQITPVVEEQVEETPTEEEV